ncbi:MAG: hypothetical protein U0797_15720 [Gemmataceae bacterium]
MRVYAEKAAHLPRLFIAARPRSWPRRYGAAQRAAAGALEDFLLWPEQTLIGILDSVEPPAVTDTSPRC